MGQPNSVRELHAVMEHELEQERTERRHELRRTVDRMDRLELEQARQRRILFGETGANGIVSEVKHNRTWERIGWFVIVVLVGIVVHFLE